MPALPSIHALTASAIFFTGYLVVLGIKIDSLLGSSSFPLYTLKGAIGTPSKTYSFFHFQTLCHKTAPVPECLPQPPERLRLPDARARKPDQPYPPEIYSTVSPGVTTGIRPKNIGRFEQYASTAGRMRKVIICFLAVYLDCFQFLLYRFFC